MDKIEEERRSQKGTRSDANTVTYRYLQDTQSSEERFKASTKLM